MVPFAKALCPVVEPGSKQMVIDPPEGLLDLFSYKAMRKVRTVRTHAHPECAGLAAQAARHDGA